MNNVGYNPGRDVKRPINVTWRIKKYHSKMEPTLEWQFYKQNAKGHTLYDASHELEKYPLCHAGATAQNHQTP